MLIQNPENRAEKEINNLFYLALKNEMRTKLRLRVIEKELGIVRSDADDTVFDHLMGKASNIVARCLKGEIDPTWAGLELEKEGLPLPEILIILIKKLPAPEWMKMPEADGGDDGGS